MSRTDPPPRPAPEPPASESSTPASEKRGIREAREPDTKVHDTLGAQEAPTNPPSYEEGDDPHPSPFERITVIPEISEREYVARMMGDMRDSDAMPMSRKRTPPRGTDLASLGLPALGSISPIGNRSMAPLTLDLTDPNDAEGHGGGRERMGVRERSTFPAARQVAQPSEGAPPLSFGPGGGNALDLVQVRAQSVRPAGPPAVSMREVRDRFDVGDFSGALVLAEGILEFDPESVDALLYAEHCRDVLKQMYISHLGGVRSVPRVAVSAEQMRWLSLDHRAGFLLSLVDGVSTFEEVLDMSGMPDFEALRLLMQLLQQNVIKVR